MSAAYRSYYCNRLIFYAHVSLTVTFIKTLITTSPKGIRREMLSFRCVCILVIASVCASTGGVDIIERGEACEFLTCLPHQCKDFALSDAARACHLNYLRRELEALPQLSAAETAASKAFFADQNKSTNSVASLLITVGGPARAESIVQAHVLLDTLRVLHADVDTKVEVWHAGEPGMDQACSVWARLYAPLVCFHTHDEAIKLVPENDDATCSGDTTNGSPSSGGHKSCSSSNGHQRTALARALGLRVGTNTAAAAAPQSQKGYSGISATTQAPPLEWVRGWPIKPLALLLTQASVVLMVDADVVPLVGIASLLQPSTEPADAIAAADGTPTSAATTSIDNTLTASFRKHGNVFWPDITSLASTGHSEIRSALGLPAVLASTSSSSSSSTSDDAHHHHHPPLSAESGQLLVARDACLQALRAAWILNAHPVTYKLLHGDKDTFKLAFDWVNHQRALKGNGVSTVTDNAVSPHPPRKVDEDEAQSATARAHASGAQPSYNQVAWPPQALGFGGGRATMVDGSTASVNYDPEMKSIHVSVLLDTILS